MPLNEATIDILRQTSPEIPRHVGYAGWMYERSPYTRGTWNDGVRVQHKPSGAEGVIVGTRLKPASTILVQVRWDNTEYAPGRCDVAFEWDLEPIGRATTPTVRGGQLSLLDEVAA